MLRQPRALTMLIGKCGLSFWSISSTPGTNRNGLCSSPQPHPVNEIPTRRERAINPQPVGNADHDISRHFGHHHHATGEGQRVFLGKQEAYQPEPSGQLEHKLIVGVTERAIHIKTQCADPIETLLPSGQVGRFPQNKIKWII